MGNSFFRATVLFGVILAFAVVGLGAYTRLTDAGLGCPDWPGCYGQLSVPSDQIAQSAFPNSPLMPQKAWTEMIHRYLAGTLGLVILLTTILGIRQKHYFGLVLVGLVIMQALFGMWTVTLKLLPLVVLGHLLGGLATLSLLWWWWLSLTPHQQTVRHPLIRRILGVGIGLLAVQIILGGLTSSHFAALICPDFPQCAQDSWFAGAQLSHFFHFNQFTADTLISIHMVHRMGAAVVAMYLIGLMISVAMAKGTRPLIKMNCLLLSLLILQLALGVSNVLFKLPLAIAVGHHWVAATLLLVLIRMFTLTGSAHDHSSH